MTSDFRMPLAGNLPAGWSIRRLGALGTLVKGRGGSKEDNCDLGVPVVRYGDLYTRFGATITEPLAFVSEETARNYTPLPTNSIVFAASGESAEDIGKASLSLLAEPAVVGGDTIVLHPNGACDPLFLTYALESGPLRASKAIRSTGFTVVHISAGRLKTIPVPIPPLNDQRAIADYLVRETAQIDALIEKQQRLIAMLRDRRRSVLDRVASDAGEPSLRLKYLYRESGIADHSGEEVLSVYRDYGVIPKSSRSDNFNRTPENVERYLLVRPGDLVINRMKAWQGSLGVSQHRGIVSGDYEVVRPIGDQLLPEFAHLYLRSARMIEQYKIRSTGIRPSQWRIYWAQTGMLEIPVPDMAMQRALVDRASEQTTKIQALIAKAERFIELARERRSALITAAVTGQIDVRGEAA